MYDGRYRRKKSLYCTSDQLNTLLSGWTTGTGEDSKGGGVTHRNMMVVTMKLIQIDPLKANSSVVF